tara:strand:+ start:2059 stop:5466 length:3408 start_codon:yes stop_codon:yes gene_type:complete
MFKYIFNRAKNQWKLLSLLWISFLIANTFIISGPTYLGWVKKMIYEDGLNQTPPTTRNISLTTGSQPLIKDSFDENNLIINNLANQNLSELFIEQSSVIQSTEYFWGKEEPNNNRTASKLKFISIDKEENFIDIKDKLNDVPRNFIRVTGPKKRLEQLGLKIGDKIVANSIKGSKNLDAGLNETKKNLKNFIKEYEAQGFSKEDLFKDSKDEAILQIQQGMSFFEINNVEQLNKFIDGTEEKIENKNLELIIEGYFEEINQNELFGYYEELFLPPSPCMTCQLPLVLVMNQKDYFEYLEPLTKGLPVRAWWYLDIDHKKLTENIRTNYLSKINNFENNMLISFPQAVVLTQLDRITENTIKEMNFVRAPVLIIFSLLGIFSSTLLIMFSYLINQERREEINYLFLRGVSKSGVIKYFFYEWLLLGIPVMIIAPFISNLTIRFVIKDYLNIDPKGIDIFYVNINSALISLGFLIIASLFSFIFYVSLNNQLVNSKRLSMVVSKIRTNVFTRYFLDIFLGIGAILIFFELRMRVISSIGENSALGQYTFLLIPSALMIFLAMLFIRMLPIFFGLLDIFGRVTFTPIYLSSKKLSKNSGWYMWFFLIISLGIASFIVISSLQSSLEKSKKDKSSFITMSDFRISESSPFGIEDEYIEGLSLQGGVNKVGRMNSLTGNTGTTGSGTESQLLGVDKNLVDITWSRDDFFNENKSIVFSGWSNEEYKPGILIEDEISKINIKNYANKDLEDSFLWVVVKGSDSRITALSLGQIESKKWTTNSVELKNVKYPARLIAIEVYEPSSEDNSKPFELYLNSIELINSNNNVIKNIPFDNSLNWTELPTSEGFDTTINYNSEGLILNLGNGSTRGIRGMYLSNYDQGIPVVVNSEFIEESGIEIGERFIFNSSGSYIPMKIEKKINYFSGTSEKYESFLITDLRLLKNYMELTKLQSFRPNELVVLIDDGFQENSSIYIEENFPLSTIKDKSLIEQNSLVTAIAVISWKGISIISLWAFIILISIGFIGFYIANEIQSSQDNAINDAIGISPISRFVMSFFEYGVVIISAILIGLFSGVVMSRVLNQLVMSLDISTKTSFPETLVISWINVISAIIVLSILYFACSLIFSLLSTRIKVSELIKKVN